MTHTHTHTHTHAHTHISFVVAVQALVAATVAFYL